MERPSRKLEADSNDFLTRLATQQSALDLQQVLAKDVSYAHTTTLGSPVATHRSSALPGIGVDQAIE